MTRDGRACIPTGLEELQALEVRPEIAVGRLFLGELCAATGAGRMRVTQQMAVFRRERSILGLLIRCSQCLEKASMEPRS